VKHRQRGILLVLGVVGVIFATRIMAQPARSPDEPAVMPVISPPTLPEEIPSPAVPTIPPTTPAADPLPIPSTTPEEVFPPPGEDPSLTIPKVAPPAIPPTPIPTDTDDTPPSVPPVAPPATEPETPPSIRPPAEEIAPPKAPAEVPPATPGARPAPEDRSAPDGQAVTPEPIFAVPLEDPGDFAAGYETTHPAGYSLDWPNAATGCEVCGGGSCNPPGLYIYQGVRILGRSKTKGAPLSYELLPASGAFIRNFGTSDLAFDVAAGYETKIGRHLGRDSENRDQFLEFSYWGLNHWSVTESALGEAVTYNATIEDPDNPGETIQVPRAVAGNLFTPFPTEVGGFNRALVHTATYRSDIHDFELNVWLRPRGRDRLVLRPDGRWRRECQTGHFFSFLFGVRYLSIDEQFDLASRGRINVFDDDGNLVADGLLSGDYFIRTHNDLVGIQIGADLMQRNCKWSYGVRVKAGPFVNFSDQFSRAVSSAPDDPFATQTLNESRVDRQDQVSLVGEVGFVGTYHIRPNLALRASYDFMWVTGLALAPAQLTFDTNPPAAIQTEGTAFYHGLSLGAEWTW